MLEGGDECVPADGEETDEEQRDAMEVALARANVLLQIQKHQWEEEKSTLLAQQQEQTSILLAKLQRARQDLANERRHRQAERFCLMESLNAIQRSLEVTDTTNGNLTDRLNMVEEMMVDPKKKPKTQSLWKHFRRL